MASHVAAPMSAQPQPIPDGAADSPALLDRLYRAAPGPTLSVVAPTRNERDNVIPLYNALSAALAKIDWEVIFVDDDSDDGTPDAVQWLARHDRRVRLVRRIGRRGLSSACVEGMQASTAPFVAVIDADLQHDETLLPRMLAMLMTEPLDIVVGSRYVEHGGIGTWSSGRARLSELATRLGRRALRAPIADPMSGFFMLRREAFATSVRNLSSLGFKILIDLLASSPQPLRAKELPYEFRARHAGESKLDALVAWEYLMLLADKLFGRFVPVRFLSFSIVGGIGILAHLAALWMSLNLLQLPFSASQAIATGAAMAGNFALNNVLTYRDRRLRGWSFVRGLMSFCLVCSIGALANVSIATLLFDRERALWWVAGLAGAAMSAVWNYAVSSLVTWRAN
ncbi:MAG TPA: glycosyltransferase family 2 protein [Xanthobacteraceae bacterium]|jgi:dolichol-phosphate mannosyltransferase|nr:glycosyltransferase family 2 protein [Xanthobacteraceae bacterium]